MKVKVGGILVAEKEPGDIEVATFPFLIIKNNFMRVLIQIRDLRIGNGIATCIMNYYPHTVSDKISIDFLLNRFVDSIFMEQVLCKGSKVYVLPKDINKPCIANWKYMEKVLKTGHYDVLHTNISGWNALAALLLAQKNGVKKRIYHAHNPRENSSLKARLRSLIYETPSVWLANRYMACSQLAGKSLFGKHSFDILPNSFDTSRYVFNIQVRANLRKQLSIENCFVVGVVGRLSEQKNPLFVVDILAEMIKQKSNVVLLWIGSGPMEHVVIQKAQRLGIKNSLILLGNREDVNRFYSAMDVFLLPSFFEGLGIVFVEAQLSGLPTFGNDTLPVEINISPLMYRLSLKLSAKTWAKTILNVHIVDRKKTLVCSQNSIFEIKNTSNLLREYYSNC